MYGVWSQDTFSGRWTKVFVAVSPAPADQVSLALRRWDSYLVVGQANALMPPYAIAIGGTWRGRRGYFWGWATSVPWASKISAALEAHIPGLYTTVTLPGRAPTSLTRL